MLSTEFPDIPAARSHAHVRVVIGGASQVYASNSSVIEQIDVADGFVGISCSKLASAETLCGSLPQTHVCAGKPGQSSTCSGTTSAVVWPSPYSYAPKICLKSEMRAQVASES